MTGWVIGLGMLVSFGWYIAWNVRWWRNLVRSQEKAE